MLECKACRYRCSGRRLVNVKKCNESKEAIGINDRCNFDIGCAHSCFTIPVQAGKYVYSCGAGGWYEDGVYHGDKHWSSFSKKYLDISVGIFSRDSRGRTVIGSRYEINSYNIEGFNVEGCGGCVRYTIDVDPTKVPRIKNITAVLVRREGDKDRIRIRVEFEPIDKSFAGIWIVYAPNIVGKGTFSLPRDRILTIDVLVPAGQKNICFMVL